MSYDDDRIDRADLDRGNEHREQDRLDRLASKAPATDGDPLAGVQGTKDDAFLDASDRAIQIVKAADDMTALAAGVGTSLPELYRMGRAHFTDSHIQYPDASLPDLIVLALADAFLLGALIGRELPR